MGEAAEMAGFPGLQAVCAHVVQNTLLAATMEVADRGPLLKFLRRWPALMVHYLRHLDDPSSAAGLVDHLREAPSALGEGESLKVAHMLGSMPAQVSSVFGEMEQQRPVLASADDVAMVVPQDVDRKLLEGFTEAPDQARYLVELARNIASGQGDSSDLIAAKRVVHTMKGSGSIIGLRGLASVGHHLEDILEHFERHGGQVARVAADVLLDAAFCLEQMIGHVLGEDEYPQQSQAVLQAVLDVANRIDRGESLEGSAVRVPSDRTQTEATVARAAPARRRRLSGHRLPYGRPARERAAGGRAVPRVGRGVGAHRGDGGAAQGDDRACARAAGAEPACAKAAVRDRDAGRRAFAVDDARTHASGQRCGTGSTGARSVQ
jgi:chemosensory pili system protein ChpA (sensor histidine kinase/response regulator)